MPDIIPLPVDYAAWLAELKTRLYKPQQRGTLAIKRELRLSSNQPCGFPSSAWEPCLGSSSFLSSVHEAELLGLGSQAEILSVHKTFRQELLGRLKLNGKTAAKLLNAGLRICTSCAYTNVQQIVGQLPMSIVYA